MNPPATRGCGPPAALENHDRGAFGPLVAGLLLAAGAGRRFGSPKALARLGGEPLLARGMRLLTDGGCHPVLAVLGAQADRIRAEAGLPDACIVIADGWAEGVGASLRAGLAALAGSPDVAATVVTLVDQPYLGPEAVRRMVSFGAATAAPTATPVAADVAVAAGRPQPAAVATYGGRPGHPVLLPRPAWAEIASLACGDVGARAWLWAFPERVVAIPCDGTGFPDDMDIPGDRPGQ